MHVNLSAADAAGFTGRREKLKVKTFQLLRRRREFWRPSRTRAVENASVFKAFMWIQLYGVDLAVRNDKSSQRPSFKVKVWIRKTCRVHEEIIDGVNSECHFISKIFWPHWMILAQLDSTWTLSVVVTAKLTFAYLWAMWVMCQWKILIIRLTYS